MRYTEMTVTCQCGNTFTASVDTFGVYWCDVCDEYKGGKVDCLACTEPQHCNCNCATCKSAMIVAFCAAMLKNMSETTKHDIIGDFERFVEIYNKELK